MLLKMIMQSNTPVHFKWTSVPFNVVCFFPAVRQQKLANEIAHSHHTPGARLRHRPARDFEASQGGCWAAVRPAQLRDTPGTYEST